MKAEMIILSIHILLFVLKVAMAADTTPETKEDEDEAMTPSYLPAPGPAGEDVELNELIECI
jgi:hypothetical protein